MAFSILDSLRLRSQVQTFVAFIIIKKAFDSSWVEATLSVFTTSRSPVPSGTCLPTSSAAQSQVRIGDSASQQQVDTGIGSCLTCSSTVWPLSAPLFLVSRVLTDSQADLEALNAVHAWGASLTFGVGPQYWGESAVMVFGPLRGRPDCSLHLGGVPLPLVS